MADDDDKPKKHTIETLFRLYANNIVISMDLDNEVYESILLSQIDYWLDQAKLLRTVFSLTETGLAYMRFRKWRLDFEDFQEFLQIICEGKSVTLDEVKQMLLDAGIPGSSTGDVVVVK